MQKCFHPHSTAMRQLRSGPLSNYLDGFAELLVQQGYCNQAGWKKVRLVADLSRWLERRHIKLKQLDKGRADTFLRARWKRVSRQSGDQITMSQLLGHLRRSQAIPNTSTTPLNEIELLEQEYNTYRGSRNLRNRSNKVRELLWLLKKD